MPQLQRNTVVLSIPCWSQTQPVTIRFKAVVGAEDFACGRSYHGIGVTKSTIKPKDFRFYVHNVRLLDEKGREVPVQQQAEEIERSPWRQHLRWQRAPAIVYVSCPGSYAGRADEAEYQ